MGGASPLSLHRASHLALGALLTRRVGEAGRVQRRLLRPRAQPESLEAEEVGIARLPREGQLESLGERVHRCRVLRLRRAAA